MRSQVSLQEADQLPVQCEHVELATPSHRSAAEAESEEAEADSPRDNRRRRWYRDAPTQAPVLAGDGRADGASVAAVEAVAEAPAAHGAGHPHLGVGRLGSDKFWSLVTVPLSDRLPGGAHH